MCLSIRYSPFNIKKISIKNSYIANTAKITDHIIDLVFSF